MSEETCISIILPVYNTEQYIFRCLDSIICQEFENLEIILVDDGSNDNCGAICNEYAKLDSRIEVIHQVNAGQSRARNVGVGIAKSEYIGFVDSDDWILPQMFEKLKENILAAGADIVNCGVLRHGEEGVIVSRFDHFPVKVSNTETGVQLVLLGRIPTAPWNKLYKQTIFRDIRFPEGMYYEDEYIMPYIFDKASKIVYLDEQLYAYNERVGSTIHSAFSKKDIDQLDALHDHIQSFSKRYPDLMIKLQKRYYDACCSVFTKALVFHAAEETKRKIFERLQSSLNDIRPLLKGGNLLEAKIAKCGYYVYTIYRLFRLFFGEREKF